MHIAAIRIFFYIFLGFWGGLAAASETADPFNTKSAVPQRPALHLAGTVSDPCEKQPLDHSLNLFEVVNLALCNNPQTLEVWANSRVQAAQLGISQADYLPSINLNASLNRTKAEATPVVNQANVGVTLSYLLYDFGSRAANLESARQLLAATSASQDSTVQTMFLNAVEAFYQTQAAYSALDAANESERSAKESFAAAEARYNAGSATSADKLQAKTAYSQATLNRITAEGNLKNAQGLLANITGFDANKNVSITSANTLTVPENFEGDVNALIEEARRHRPDLQAAAAQVKVAEANADAMRASGMPTISVTTSANQYNNNPGFNSRNSMIGINLNVPIFSGFAPTYRVRAAEAQIDAKNIRFEQLRLQVALDVWTAYQNLNTATESLRSSSDLLHSAEESERVAMGRYKAGVGSMLNVLSAQSALASALQQRIQSTLNWNISRATLAQAMGHLDLNLLQILPDNKGQFPDKNKIQKQ